MPSKIRHFFNHIDIGLIIVIILPLIGILPTFGEGLANGADAPFHAHRIYALSDLLKHGILYPRWVTYFHMGYGYPIFNFYAPGATYIGAFFQLAGFSTITAYNLVNALMWCMSSVGMYKLARLFFPIHVAILAAVLWVYAPSRLFEFWWQGSLAQIVATSFIPFVIYGIIRTSRQPTLKNALWIALPFAAIILSHTPTTYITALIIAPLCIIAPLHLRQAGAIVHRWIFIGIGLLLAAGLSAIFLIPVFLEVSNVRIAGDFPNTISYLTSKFLTLNEIFTITSLIDSSDITLIIPRTLGLIGGGLSLIGLLALVRHKRYALALILAIGLIFTVFMMLEPSLNIWLAIPSFRNLRFPERLLRMGAIFIALLGASSLLIIPKRWQISTTILLSAILIAQALAIVHPRDDDRIWTNLSAVDEIEMEFTERNWGTTAYDEYEPYWGEVTPYDMPPEVETYADSPFQIRIKESDLIRDSDKLTYERISDNQLIITLKEAQTVRFRQFYFPGWQVMVDKAIVPIRPDTRFGLIEIDLDAGEHLIQLDYVGTEIQTISSLISLITALICILIVFRGKNTSIENAPTESFNRKIGLVLIFALVIFAVLNNLVLNKILFRIESQPTEPAYMQNRLDVRFDESIQLLGYTLDSNSISPNNPLGIRLYWYAEKPIEIQYRPLVQLVNLNLSEAWAVSEPLTLEGGQSTVLNPEQFMSDYHQLKLFDEVPPYVAQISVQLINSDDESYASLEDGSNRLILSPKISIEDITNTSYQGRESDIVFGDAIQLLCIGVEPGESDFQLNLWWRNKQSVDRDYHIFIHGLDSNGELIRQNDSLPLNGLYPTSFWRETQVLNDSHTLPYDERIVSIALGLYDSTSGIRLPVIFRGEESDHIEISADESSCQ